MNLRTWYELTAGSHAGPDGYEQFVFWCEEHCGGNVERLPPDLWPGFLAWWLGLDVPLKEGSEFYDPLGAQASYEPMVPSPIGITTWNEFFDAVNEPLFQKVLTMAGGDKSKAEDWFAEILICLVASVQRAQR